ncbi:uncharacterized protein LOC131663432 isoform X2 [Phymastichus coffea]|uniref:uncharacterized protein LOC131663432 isoform X2 n=1 Tax=Phymastichus coffea TaxID=108790 RepID=UPI00273A8C86|nr:uncharacterized protein LOC131663432 isoform X2 [Phymastichus coffea]
MVTRPRFERPPARGSGVSFHEKAWVERYAAAKVPNSIEMLARFQKRQLQEKEQKLLRLYDQQQQRAHQVAQRGSAGSNGSDHSVAANPAKVKQSFADDRRQQNGVKGIDKSYPLEPLRSSKKNSAISKTSHAKPTTGGGGGSSNSGSGSISSSSSSSNNNNNNNNSNNNSMANRKLNSIVASTTARRVIKADVNSNGGGRGVSVPQNFGRQQENSSRGESIRQVNGHATNNGYHYEINIDEVIDNEALQRNRILAKFQPGDIERRRRQLSGAAAAAAVDVDVDGEFPEDATQRDVGSRKSSLKNAKSSGNPAIGAAKKTTIPRASTLMKTTQSASLKVCKAPTNRSRLVMRRKSSLVARKPKESAAKPIRKKSAQPPDERCCEISERCFPPPWNTLKSTSLICEIIRKHSKLQQMRSKSKMGRVKSIVTKIENQTILVKPSAAVAGSAAAGTAAAGAATTPRFIPVAKSIENKLLEMTRGVEPAESKSHEPLDLLNANFVEALKAAESNEAFAKQVESEQARDDADADADAESPSDYQQTAVANRAAEQQRDHSRVCPTSKLSAEDVNCVRRASFEQKRMMFELLYQRQRVSRHNSVESVLRHFDAIDDEPAADGKQSSSRRACRRGSASSDTGARRILRGFERSTSAWTIRTAKPPKYGRDAKANGKKILQARDSIELARVPVITNLPACKKKIMSQSKKSHENDDASGCSSRRSDRPSSPEVSAKFDCYVGSVTKAEAPVTSSKKSDPLARATDTASLVKNVPPYPSSKSPEHTEPRSGSVVKATSMKLLGRFAGSNGDVASTVPTETADHPATQRKSSIPLDSLQSDELPIASRVPITPAPRTSSSTSSVGATRSQGSRGTVATAKTKAPTPAIRTTAPSNGSANADDSLITCKICARRFQPERVAKHEQICAKTAQKKRKQFDAVGHRVKGTELESFVQKPNKKQGKVAVAVVSKAEPQKSNWRRKHEDFINAIRSAKQMQAHVAAGGKLSDLPPPPPSDTSDYVQCPHCSRKFNQGAAERHVPKCETMQHNKPKPRPKR